jgi:NADPH-dependent 2,4-dienoyl-CoA reductase/sulfur reductase-like enzyme
MRTSDKNIWACGDVASHPWSFNGQRMTVGHYSSSITSGSVAAFNMMSKFTPNTDVPTFWTKQFDKNVLFTGNGKNWDTTVVDGDLSAMNFSAYHIKDHRVEGVSAAGKRGMDAMLVNSAMKLNIIIKAHELYDGKLDMEKLRDAINKKRPNCMCNRKVNNEKAQGGEGA